MAADEATTRLEDVQRVTEAALAYLDLDDLLDELLQRVTDILHADTAAVLLVEDDGRTLAATGGQGPRGGGRARFPSARRARIRRSRGGNARSPSSSPISTTRRSTVVNPLMREKRVRSLLGVPLIVEGQGDRRAARRNADPARLPAGRRRSYFSCVADRVALSIERSRLAVQGQIAQTLQRSLLPRRLPQLPGVEHGRLVRACGRGDRRRRRLVRRDRARTSPARSDHRGRRRPRYGRRHPSWGSCAARCGRTPSTSSARRRCSPSSRASPISSSSRMATMVYATLNLDTLGGGLRARRAPVPAADPRRWERDVPVRRRWPASRHRRGRDLRRAANHARGGGDPAALHRRPDRAPREHPDGGRVGAR